MQSEGEMCIFYDGLLAGEANLNPPPRRGKACYAEFVRAKRLPRDPA